VSPASPSPCALLATLLSPVWYDRLLLWGAASIPPQPLNFPCPDGSGTKTKLYKPVSQIACVSVSIILELNVHIRVGLVWSGTTVVRTKRSEALLKCALGCALLAHFASEVQSLQAKCALKIGVRRPSAHLRDLTAPQTDFATCALPKCASRAQNPTFAP
jgi:hypothetical protein